MTTKALIQSSCRFSQRVGSYPKLHAGVDVSLIGKDEARLAELGVEGTFFRNWAFRSLKVDTDYFDPSFVFQ